MPTVQALWGRVSYQARGTLFGLRRGDIVDAWSAFRGYPNLRSPFLPPLAERGHGLVFGPGICLVKNTPQYAVISTASCFVGANILFAVAGNMMQNSVFNHCLSSNGWPVEDSRSWALGVFKIQQHARSHGTSPTDFNYAWWVHDERYFADIPHRFIEVLTWQNNREAAISFETIGSQLAGGVQAAQTSLQEFQPPTR